MFRFSLGSSAFLQKIVKITLKLALFYKILAKIPTSPTKEFFSGYCFDETALLLRTAYHRKRFWNGKTYKTKLTDYCQKTAIDYSGST